MAQPALTETVTEGIDSLTDTFQYRKKCGLKVNFLKELRSWSNNYNPYRRKHSPLILDKL